jgi:hypothetical protein
MSKEVVVAIIGGFILGFTSHASAAVTDIKVVPSPALVDIPPGISVKGHPKELVRWKDRLGDNVLILSETGAVKKKGTDERDASLYAVHSVRTPTGQTFQMLWTMNDGVEECSYDLDVSFLGKTLVTDLDQDGTAETTMTYVLICRSDASPAPAKLILHEGKTKYAMQGTGGLPGSKEPAGGTMELDSSFSQAPESIRQFAINIWKSRIGDSPL